MTISDRQNQRRSNEQVMASVYYAEIEAQYQDMPDLIASISFRHFCARLYGFVAVTPSATRKPWTEAEHDALLA